MLAPLAICAGWLTAATDMSVGILLSSSGRLPGTAAVLLMLSIALAVAVTAQARLACALEYRPTGIRALGIGFVRHGTTNPPVTEPRPRAKTTARRTARRWRTKALQGFWQIPSKEFARTIGRRSSSP